MKSFRNILSRLPRLPFTSPGVGLALSGGGCKAFFGLGVGQVLLEEGIPIRGIAGTSAGSAMSLTLVSRKTEEVVRYFYSVTKRNHSNFHFRNLFRWSRPWPHERMYRRTIASYIDVDEIQNGPIEVYINALRLPPELYPPNDRMRRSRLLAQMARAAQADFANSGHGMFRQVMPEFAREAGLEERIFSRRDFTNKKRIEDIVLAASSVPPLVSFQQLEGGDYYLDGGITHNLPVGSLQDYPVIVAVYYDEWTRSQLELSGDDRGKTIVYVKPDANLKITTWDYANPEGVRHAYEMGRQAGQRTLRILGNIR